MAGLFSVGPEFFKTMQIPMVAGREYLNSVTTRCPSCAGSHAASSVFPPSHHWNLHGLEELGPHGEQPGHVGPLPSPFLSGGRCTGDGDR